MPPSCTASRASGQSPSQSTKSCLRSFRLLLSSSEGLPHNSYDHTGRCGGKRNVGVKRFLALLIYSHPANQRMRKKTLDSTGGYSLTQEQYCEAVAGRAAS